METNKVIVQKLKQQVDSPYTLAERYYSILSALNNLHLTPREIQLIAFTAVKGNISYSSYREEFCTIHETTTSPAINNIISKMKRKDVLIKDKGKIKVNPQILLNFNLDVILQIKLNHIKEIVNQ